jgi:hypothetical protein
VCFIYVILAPFYLFYAYLGLELSGAAAGAVAAVVIPGCYIVSMFRVLAQRPADLPAPRWFPAPPPEGEPAELSYFYGFNSPAIAEVEQVATLAFGLARLAVQKGWQFITRTAFSGGTTSRARRLMLGPLAIGAIVGGAAGVIFGAVLFIIIGLVHTVVSTVVFALMWALGLLLRGIDTGLLRIKNIRMTCPTCFERVPYPAYMCPSQDCTRMHHNVRPGRYGIFRRRCQCSESLPTLLLLGSARLPAYCPHEGCGRPMEHRPGEAQEVVLPFFGAAGAGKTRLLYGIVTLLRSTPGLEAEFADSSTGTELSEVKSLLAPGQAPKKTTTALPRGQVMRVTSHGDTRLLQLYDSAGELFYQSERTQELGYLTKARTFVLVIDPLSVEYLWRSLPAERQAELTAVRSTASPELAYQQTHQQMEAMGVRLKKSRLAVVFSRADLLDGLNGDSVIDWVEDSLGLGNLVRSIRHQFGEAEFFRTAAVLGDNGTVDPSVLELTRWIVARDGISLADTQLSGRIA